MGIFGTLIGGTLGFAMGGPVGAILGGVLGGSIGESLQQPTQGGYARPSSARHQHPLQQQQMVFAVALTSLAAKVAKADGRVTQEEISAFDQFLKANMRMSVDERRFAARVFNEARDSSTPASEFASQVRQVFRGQPDRLRDIVTILLMVALADGSLHPAEESLIQQVARDLGLSQADYQSCRATFFASRGEPETSPYEVLGVAPTATDDEVRSAHRRLVREYHPDVIQSKGLPDEFMNFAAEKMSAVNEAWTRVKKERGL